MNQTANYQLNQWEASDRILMSDFNEDNAKIDAALADLPGKLGPVELITEVAITENCGSYALSLSGIDWDQWSIIAIEMDLISYVNYQVTTVTTSFNGVPATSGKVDAGYSPMVGPRMLVMFPLRDSSNPVRGLLFPGGTLQFSQGSYEDVTGVTVGSDNANSYAAGSKFRVFGIR